MVRRRRPVQGQAADPEAVLEGSDELHRRQLAPHRRLALPRMRALPAAIVAALLSVVLLGCGADAEPAEPSPPPAPPGFFGVVPQAQIFEEDMDRMAAGKIKTMRVVVPWGLIDSTAKPDDLNWGYLDPTVGGAAARGIR